MRPNAGATTKRRECFRIFYRKKKFEKPTARVFYTKLLEETKINTKWHLARCKMRHLRALFLKANACLESTDEIVEDDNGVVTVLEKVRKICPHYDMLSDIFSHSGKAIFGDVDPELEDQIFDTDTDTSSASLKLASALDTPTMTEDSALESEPPMLKKRRVHSSAEKSPNLEEQLLALRREQLLHEREKQEQNARLEEKRISLEGENLQLEKKRIELEEQQIQNDFILKKLQLEKEERIQKLEIELKYKYKNS